MTAFQRVRIEITSVDGPTYEIELENCTDAELGIERDTMDVPTDTMWRHTIGLDSGEVTLRARGKFVKTERRAS